MKTIDLREKESSEAYRLLTGAVAPRPIAFVSTSNAAGQVNLSPFSFFNLFSANPPVLVFSPLSRLRDNSSKHTLDNVLATKEAVVNIASYALVEQMSLASTEYEKEVNEFEKAGLTAAASILVRPPRVEEAPVSLECRVTDVLNLGRKGGAGNLVLCEVLLIHVQECVLDGSGNLDPYKFDAVARMGGDFYLHATKESIFKLPKPSRQHGMGIDQLPDYIRNSGAFTGNQLARLASVPELPSAAATTASAPLVAYTLNKFKAEPDRLRQELLLLAQKLLDDGNVPLAWQVLLLCEPG